MYVCGVAQHAEDTIWSRQVPTLANDVAAFQNEQAYVPSAIYRNPSREAKHQQELLKNVFSHVGALTGREDRI